MGPEEVEGILEALKATPFSILTNTQMRAVAESADLKDFGRGEKIAAQGAPSTTFYIVIKGLVELKHEGGVLAKLGPGGFFGDTALVRDSAYAADVIALERTSCLALSGEELRSNPAVVVKVLEAAVKRNRAIAMQPEASSTDGSLQPLEDEQVAFESAKTKVLFDSLVKSFTEDYMMKRLYLEQAGWRTVGELAAATKIPHATLYGKHGNYGPLLSELISRGLVETRVFSGQRGRGGEVLRARVAYDREPVKRYVDRTVLKGRGGKK